MESDCFIGIDPGVKGGIAVLSSTGIETFKMPETEKDIFDLFRQITKDYTNLFAMIEKVCGSPYSQGQFNFGVSYGQLRMALIGNGISFDEVRPVVWQKALGCLTGGEKNVSKGKAQQLYPDLKITHFVADALLIATFCKETSYAKNRKTN